jgi:hypothetical protein
MMRRSTILLTWLLCVTPAIGHVTPTVQLVRRGDFVRSALSGASRFFEHKLGTAELEAMRSGADSHWHPSAREIKVYVGRDDQGQLVGSVVFLRVPSEHGPVGLGVAYGAAGRILKASVTEVGSEPLAWVQPLLKAHALDGLRGEPADSTVEAASLAPDVRGRMSRYYAGILAQGIHRAGRVLHAVGLAASEKGN